jgi:hypothetical protein
MVYGLIGPAKTLPYLKSIPPYGKPSISFNLCSTLGIDGKGQIKFVISLMLTNSAVGKHIKKWDPREVMLNIEPGESEFSWRHPRGISPTEFQTPLIYYSMDVRKFIISIWDGWEPTFPLIICGVSPSTDTEIGSCT